MHAFLMIGLLGVASGAAPPLRAPSEEEKLLRKIETAERELAALRKQLASLRVGRAPDAAAALEKDYQKLLEDDPRAEKVRRAAELFRAGKSDEALNLLRRARSKAGVPLILKEMLARKPADTVPHRLALTLLTGMDCVGEAPTAAGLFHDWWLPGKAKISTDPDKMTPRQRDVVARHLLLQAASRSSDSYRLAPRADTAYDVAANLYSLFLSSGYRESRRWFDDELHPALAPHLLTAIGYRPKGAAKGGALPVRYEAVLMLATLRKNGGAPQLDKVAKDVSQPAAVRLVCALALHGADEELPVRVVLDVHAREKQVEVRLPAILALYYAKDLRPAAHVLIEALDDPNAQAREAAVWAMEKNAPPAALPALKRLLQKQHFARALSAIAHVRTAEATQFLADYLQRCIKEGGPKTDKISDALWAFQDATGQRVIGAGLYPFAYYRDRAAVALERWRERKVK